MPKLVWAINTCVLAFLPHYHWQKPLAFASTTANYLRGLDLQGLSEISEALGKF